MSSALVNVIPSPYESNSISALESFMFGRPILVNGKSEVLKGHCTRSRGGLYYYNYNDFAGHLNNFKDDPNSATVMGERGRDYVLTRYNWKVIINKYLNYFQSLKPVGRKV
jgi:glycosyltransferase involved in cell wall biosynthesis